MSSCFINDTKREKFDKICAPALNVFTMIKAMIGKTKEELLHYLANDANITMMACHDNVAGSKIHDETFFHLLAKYYPRGWSRAPAYAFINTSAIDSQILEMVIHLHDAFTNHGVPKEYSVLELDAKAFIDRLKTNQIEGVQILEFKRCSAAGTDRHTILDLAKSELPKAKAAGDTENIERIEKYIQVIESWAEQVKQSTASESTTSHDSSSSTTTLEESTLELDKVNNLLEIITWLSKSPLLPNKLKLKINNNEEISEILAAAYIELEKTLTVYGGTYVTIFVNFQDYVEELIQKILRLGLLCYILYILDDIQASSKHLTLSDVLRYDYREESGKLKTNLPLSDKLKTTFNEIVENNGIRVRKGEEAIPNNNSGAMITSMFGGKQKRKTTRQKTNRRKYRKTIHRRGRYTIRRRGR